MKAELAVALVHEPQVLFLDEPTIGVDVTMQRRIREFIAGYNQRTGATVLLTSHYMADIEALCPRVIGALSKGFRQRVGIAQAIVHDPAVLILDEPTVGLDPIQIREIRALIADLAAPREGSRGHTIVLSTHILAEVEAICRRVIIINRGKKVIDTPLAELIHGGVRLEDVFARAALSDEAAA